MAFRMYLRSILNNMYFYKVKVIQIRISIIAFGLKGNENYRYPGLLGCLLTGDAEAKIPYKSTKQVNIEKYNTIYKVISRRLDS